jgi:hypothetical protein
VGRRLRKLRDLSIDDCLTLLYIYAMFFMVEFGLRVFSFSTMVKLISMRRARRSTPPRTRTQKELYLVSVASRHNIFGVTCLKKALVLFRLLRKRGVSPTLFIGVQKDRDFEAHAWVEIKGSPVLDSEAEIAPFKCIFELV